jgi:O-antigen/teichoic acid export membrane protein
MNSHWSLNTRSGLKLELLANFAGTGWSGLVQLACVPLYIKFMGIEAYGLIGFYLMLQAMVQVLDLGLSPTMNREMARYSVQPEKASEARDLVRTLEIGYWLIGFAICATILTASPWIGSHWIKASATPVPYIKHAVMLMALLAFFQWPVSFYQGGLMGLHRQVLYNSVAILFSTLSNVGAVLILWLVAPSVQAFFLWLVAVNAVKTALLAVLLWTSLPHAPSAPRFDFSRLQSVSRFAAGMTGITCIGLLLTQIDKVLVSKLLDLKTFGYYTLAWSLAGGLLIISGAVFNVIFPRMSAQVARGDENAIRQSYHRGSQLMAVTVLPLAAVIFFFSFDILRIWTRSSEIAVMVSPILRILVIGSGLNAVLFLPYALQLAFGWTKLTLLAGVVSVALVIPAMFPMTKYFGAVGAAAVWAGLNIVNMLVAVPIMHRRLLRHEAWGYFADIGFPLVTAISIAALGRVLLVHTGSPITTVTALASLWLASVFAAGFAAPRVRSWALAQL